MAELAMPAEASASPQTEPRDATRLWLTWLSLTAGIAFTATAEYDLARELGARPIIAVMLPITIDAYVCAALKWTRAFDVALSLSLMGSAQIAAHALDAGVLEVDLRMVAVVSLLVPISIWRTHALARSERRPAASPPSPTVTETVTVAERDLHAELAEVRVQRQYGLPAPDAEDADSANVEPEDAPPSDEDEQQDAPRLITSAEVAQRFGVDPSTVRGWVASGRLVVHRKDERGRNWFSENAVLKELA